MKDLNNTQIQLCQVIYYTHQLHSFTWFPSKPLTQLPLSLNNQWTFSINVKNFITLPYQQGHQELSHHLFPLQMVARTFFYHILSYHMSPKKGCSPSPTLPTLWPIKNLSLLPVHVATKIISHHLLSQFTWSPIHLSPCDLKKLSSSHLFLNMLTTNRIAAHCSAPPIRLITSHSPPTTCSIQGLKNAQPIHIHSEDSKCTIYQWTLDNFQLFDTAHPHKPKLHKEETHVHLIKIHY